MELKLSNRIQKLKTSPIRKLIPYGEEATKAGKKVHHLNIGQPDIKTPMVFYEAIRNYFEPVLKYANSAGTPELISSIIDYYARRGMKYSSEDILITSGGVEGISFALTALCDVGDEIIIPEPYYANYNSFFNTLGINVSAVRTYAETGFHLPSIEEIEKKITPKTKAIMLSNPSNPTGTVYSLKEMEMLAEVAKKYDLYIISDEVYREFVYGENRAISFGTFKEIEDRVIIVDSISKRYSACGARIGCIISKNRVLMQSIYRLCQARLCVPTLEMIGAAALYTIDDSYLETVRLEYEKRRGILYEELCKIDGVVVGQPEGAFYSVVKLPIENAEDFAMWLLKEYELNGETILITPAEGFYKTEGAGRNEIRISYAIEEEKIRTAMNILKQALSAYKS